MAYNEIRWKFPQYSAYSVLNVINPAICWNPPENNPFIQKFEVDILNTADDQWVRIADTASNFVRFPADNYAINPSYRARIATIGINGRRSPYAYSIVQLSSALVFDFTTSSTVSFSNGTRVSNQRYIFLIL